MEQKYKKAKLGNLKEYNEAVKAIARAQKIIDKYENIQKIETLWSGIDDVELSEIGSLRIAPINEMILRFDTRTTKQLAIYLLEHSYKMDWERELLKHRGIGYKTLELLRPYLLPYFNRLSNEKIFEKWNKVRNEQ